MHVENEASDRHRRIAAIVDQLGPRVVAGLRHILAKSPEKIERVLRGNARALQLPAKRQSVRSGIGLAEESVFERRKKCELCGLIEMRMNRSIVRGTREAIERKNGCAITGRNDPRRDGK